MTNRSGACFVKSAVVLVLQFARLAAPCAVKIHLLADGAGVSQHGDCVGVLAQRNALR